jgi:hypothetical protein
MDRNDFYDRDREEWQRRRDREQRWGEPGEYGARGEREFGQGGYGQGYGQGMYGRGWYGVGYGQGGYGRGGYWPGGYEGGRSLGGYGERAYQGGYGLGSWREGPAGYREGYGYGGSGPGLRYGSSTFEGRFYGRGPKGYRRSDERIRDEVNEELTRHPEIDAGEIDIKVENGEVTLTGKVADRYQKRLAEDVAERCFGVTDVHNQLKVDQGFFAKLFGTEEGREREQERGTTTRRGTAGR